MGIVVDSIEPYKYWKPSLIDAILKYGDRLYTMSLPNAKNPPHLTADEVVTEFHVTNFSVRIMFLYKTVIDRKVDIIKRRLKVVLV